MVYHGYDMTSKPNYLVDICKKLVITIIFLGCNGVSNTTKISWYIANYDIQNGVFYMLVKHIPEKIPSYSSIPLFCLKTLKIICFQTPLSCNLK
jgi:hypothetical protein